jgi:sugar phosphate isomerase/epimerase
VSSSPALSVTTPKRWRKLLDDAGLEACGSHIRLEAMQGDTLEKTIEFNKTIGKHTPHRAEPGRKYTASKKSLEDAADAFNEIADKLKPHGMRTGFHCHPGEFRMIDGESVWDIFFSRAKKDVIMQCDLGHMGTAGVDPVNYMTKYPGRASSVHVKPSAKIKRGGLVGDADDDLKWPEIFKACETLGGTEWYVVEYDGGSMEKAEKTIETSASGASANRPSPSFLHAINYPNGSRGRTSGAMSWCGVAVHPAARRYGNGRDHGSSPASFL